jgi:hypothetical protein
VYLNVERRLIYLANPKTASVSTRDALRARAGFVKWREKLHGHLGLAVNTDGGSHHGRLYKPAEGWTVACTVRNHWKTLLSWYTRHEHFQEPFNSEWIYKWLAMHERQYFPAYDKLFLFGTQFADRIMRVDSLAEDLADFLGQEIPVPRENVTNEYARMTVAEAYDEPTRDYVAWRFAAEIEEYGYAYPG